jgi:probable HAF family extracellular repeat protein
MVETALVSFANQAAFKCFSHNRPGGNMQPRTLTYITAVALFAALAVPVRLAAQAQQKNTQPPMYYIINLGQPLGSLTEPVGINNTGWITGASALTGATAIHAVAWVGTPLDLGTLGGPNSSVNWPIHATTGEIVGISENGQVNPYNEAFSCPNFFLGVPDGLVCRGFTWQNGVMTELPTLGGPDGYAASVNNKGEIVGWAENTFHDPTCVSTGTFPQVFQFEAVVWGPKIGQMTELKPFGTDPDSAATAINDKGQVAGISGLCSVAVGGASAEHALLWEKGQTVPINLGNIGGGAWNTPTAINNRGVVVGFGNTSGDQNAGFSPAGFIWTEGTGMVEIPPVSDDTNNIAFDINNNNQVVGQSAGGLEGARAFLYEGGTSYDLNALALPTSLNLVLAQGINDSGEISGTAIDQNGNQVGFLGVPVTNGSGRLPLEAKVPAKAQLSAEEVRQLMLKLPGLPGFLFKATGSK